MKILSFLNLLDANHKLSLTNIALIVILTKIALSPFDYAGAAILLPVLASYMHKRYTTAKATATEKAQESAQISSLIAQMDAFKADHEETAKTLAETKKLLSNSNLIAAFQPKR
jgi:aspartate-semialdehyde dehydrogenase